MTIFLVGNGILLPLDNFYFAKILNKSRTNLLVPIGNFLGERRDLHLRKR
jgi:hypothetical protein